MDTTKTDTEEREETRPVPAVPVSLTPALAEDDDLDDVELGAAACALGEACESCQ